MCSHLFDLGLAIYYIATSSLVRIDATTDFERVQELDRWNFLVTERSPEAIEQLAAAVPLTVSRARLPREHASLEEQAGDTGEARR